MLLSFSRGAPPLLPSASWPTSETQVSRLTSSRVTCDAQMQRMVSSPPGAERGETGPKTMLIDHKRNQRAGSTGRSGSGMFAMPSSPDR